MTGKVITFAGTPEEIGADVFIRLCMPVVREAQTKLGASPRQLAQLYSGFLGAALGSLAADFGQQQAVAIAEAVVAGLARADLGQGAGTQ